MSLYTVKSSENPDPQHLYLIMMLIWVQKPNQVQPAQEQQADSHRRYAAG